MATINFFKWANPGLFVIYFQSFQANSPIFTTNRCEKCPSSIWRQDSKPRPFKHESSPITTRPGLPPWLPLIISINGFFNYDKARIVYPYLAMVCKIGSSRSETEGVDKTGNASSAPEVTRREDEIVITFWDLADYFSVSPKRQIIIKWVSLRIGIAISRNCHLQDNVK